MKFTARTAIQDLEHLSGQPLPLRTFEMVVEAIYEAHIKPGWLLQPFFQYIFRPAGGIQILTIRQARPRVLETPPSSG